MIGAPNSLNLNCKVRVMKEAPGPSVSEEIADILTNYNIDNINVDMSNSRVTIDEAIRRLISYWHISSTTTRTPVKINIYETAINPYFAGSRFGDKTAYASVKRDPYVTVRSTLNCTKVTHYGQYVVSAQIYVSLVKFGVPCQ